MKRNFLQKKNKPEWMQADDLTYLVYYSSLKREASLVYLDLYKDPYSLLYYKVKTDFSKRGSLSLPVMILEEKGIDTNQLNIISEYEVYFVPFGVAKINTQGDRKVAVIEKKQIVGLFYSDFQKIFNMFPDIDEIQNVLIHFQSNKVKVNLKSIGELLSTDQSIEEIVNTIVKAKYNSEFFDEFFNRLLSNYIADEFNSSEVGDEDIEIDF